MIEITGTVVGTEEVQRRFVDASQTVRERVRVAVQRGGLRVLATVKEKLSDVVLHVRSGRLRRSVHEQTKVEGDTVTSTVGTPVVYARPHELGFSGVEQVRAHTRTTAHGIANVKAHARTVRIPAKPFLKPSLDENRSEIVAEIVAAMGAV